MRKFEVKEYQSSWEGQLIDKQSRAAATNSRDVDAEGDA